MEKKILKNVSPELFSLLSDEPFANFLGFELVELQEGYAKAQVDIHNQLLNSHGGVHGGVIFALADYVFAAASNSYGTMAVGVNNNINYLTAANPSAPLIATAKEIKRTRKLAWYSMEIFSEEKLVATMEAMVYIIGKDIL